MLNLHNLTTTSKKRKRVGRGGSRGGTSGKGTKGQKARSGGYIRMGFEGGQMPLFRRLPKRGFNNTQFATVTKTVNIDVLNQVFNDGDTITREILISRGVIKDRKTTTGTGGYLIKVLGNGKLSKKFIVHADAFSKSALKAIQDCGGEARLSKEM